MRMITLFLREAIKFKNKIIKIKHSYFDVFINPQLIKLINKSYLDN